MKSVRKSKWIAIFMAAVLAALLLSACGAKTYSVKIIDQNTTIAAEATSNQTVKDVLSESGVTVTDRDEVTPALDTKIDENVTEIIVSRYAKVTIIDGENKVEVELVGGDASKALQIAGIILGINDTIDCDENAFLEDGMIITIGRKNAVTVEVDGETKEVVTEAGTVEELLKELGITLSQGDTVAPEAAAVLKDGDKIVITRYVAPAQAPVAQEPVWQPDYSQDYNQQPAGRYEVSRVAYPNCADGSHGYYEVTYSDGSVEYIEY